MGRQLIQVKIRLFISDGFKRPAKAVLFRQNILCQFCRAACRLFRQFRRFRNIAPCHFLAEQHNEFRIGNRLPVIHIPLHCQKDDRQRTKKQGPHAQASANKISYCRIKNPHCASSSFLPGIPPAIKVTFIKKAQPNQNEKTFSHLSSGPCPASLLMMKYKRHPGSVHCLPAPL